VTFRRELAPDEEGNLKAVPRKQRAMIRKGQQAGLVSERDQDLDRFYPVFAESYRNLGTPVLGRRYFDALLEVFGPQAQVLTILDGSVPVASVLSFRFRDEILPYYGGGTDAARANKANDFMYWEVLRRALEEGVRVFDFGRSKEGTGSYRFKKHWGFEPEPLAYQYHLVRAKTLPDVNPLNPKYQRMIATWQRLPLGVTRLVGPWIARNLG
jgi:FemAB-related protein (PEP-CTERM system-associated)